MIIKFIISIIIAGKIGGGSRLRRQQSLGVVNPVKLRKLIELSKKIEQMSIENENESFIRLKDNILNQKRQILETENQMFNKYREKCDWESMEFMKKKIESDLKNRINSYESDLRHRLKKCESTVGELKFVKERNKAALVNLDSIANSLKSIQNDWKE